MPNVTVVQINCQEPQIYLISLWKCHWYSACRATSSEPNFAVLSLFSPKMAYLAMFNYSLSGYVRSMLRVDGAFWEAF